jgi:ribosomal protein S27AE
MHGLSIDQIKAAQAIMDCQSDELGYEEWVCHSGDYVKKQNHSCRHRSCPRCNGSQQHDWLEKIKAKLLPCNHYHVVFTLPHELNDIWHYNRSWCAEKLFQATAETVRELLKDARYLGAEVGILSSLHTWGRSLIFHPHMHMLVTGLGLMGEEIREVEKDFLLPVGVLKAKFRGKWLSWLNRGYDNGEIQLPDNWSVFDWRRVLRQVARKNWNIRIQGSYKHGDGVAIYLSRYVRGGPIKDKRIVKATPENVIFRYKDHVDGAHKVMSLKTAIFMTRVMWHVAVKGQHQVRYYGLYASGGREKRDLIRMNLGEVAETDITKEERDAPRCPECGQVLFHARSTRREISYIRSSRVQQDVRATSQRGIFRYERWLTPPYIFLAARGRST